MSTAGSATQCRRSAGELRVHRRFGIRRRFDDIALCQLYWKRRASMGRILEARMAG
jgi:hypothetical protein